MIDKNDVNFSSMKQSDIPFIFSSWVQSYWSTIKGSMPRGQYKKNQRKVVDNLLNNSFCIVATNPQDLDQIFGYIIYTDDVIHYLYVKESFRTEGIGRALIERAKGHGLNDDFEVSHKTNYLKYLIPNFKHNHFKAFQ